MPRRTKLRFFLDQNVPDSVRTVFEKRGHDVTLLRTVLPTDTPDPVVATTAQSYDAILVSFDKDFGAKRELSHLGLRHGTLSRIHLRCKEPEAVARLTLAIALIEAEWRESRKRTATRKRMIVEILGFGIKTLR
jgi:predicted nuclease of predicted toxin-antitoxin system